ncbi:MAG: carboxypeptidase regulatory-like domain-containing protein [Methylococcales bacterium]|nr:carboxypeptidase regulatory-like domain-containing protein [Methylococcales bacterium]
MNTRFFNKWQHEISEFSHTAKWMWFVGIIIFAMGVWITATWLSPNTIISKNTNNGIGKSFATEQNIKASKSTRQTNTSITATPSQTGIILETDYQVTLNPSPIKGAQKKINKNIIQTKPTDTDTIPPESQDGWSISGMVLDESGKPIADIELITLWKNFSLVDGGMDIPASERKWQAVTGFDGYYQIQDLEEGEYQIRSEANALYQAASIVVRTGIESADLILRKKQPDIHIYGTIQSEGEPLTKVRVVPTGQSKNAVFSDEEGHYNLVVDISSRLKLYTLRISHQDYQEQSFEFQVAEMLKKGEIQLNLELKPIAEQAEVTGNLRSSNSSSVSEEKVQLYSETTKRRYLAVSDQNGAFWFPEVEPAPDYFLSVNPASYYQDYLQKDVQITSSGLDVDVVLKPLKLGTLTGQMVDPNGKPVSGFSLWLRNNEASSFPALNVTSDSRGHFNVNEIPEGKLVFDTRSSPLFSITGFHQSAEETTNAQLVLDWGDHVVPGRIVNNHGKPIPAAEISLTWFHRDGEVRSYSTRKAVTNSDGYFMFSKVSSGMHTLRIDIPNYRYTQRDHVVGETDSEIIIRLEDDA